MEQTFHYVKKLLALLYASLIICKIIQHNDMLRVPFQALKTASLIVSLRRKKSVTLDKLKDFMIKETDSAVDLNKYIYYAFVEASCTYSVDISYLFE